uniref:RHS domain-containing protein n=1 Tax=Cronobacter dublinensis TaxID=413497 RepID=UPI00374DACD6
MQLRHGGATHTLAAYGRDRLHREISRSQGARSQETHYDTAGRITQRTVLDARRELVFERRYRRDRTDQIVQQIHTDATPATPGEKYSQYLWGYDAAGQVTKAIEPQRETPSFRLAGVTASGRAERQGAGLLRSVRLYRGSYEPLGRVNRVFENCEIYWYHTELNRLPERVTDADGLTVWCGQFSTWGKAERELSVSQ